jgi:hypothetical protein
LQFDRNPRGCGVRRFRHRLCGSALAIERVLTVVLGTWDWMVIFTIASGVVVAMLLTWSGWQSRRRK